MGNPIITTVQRRFNLRGEFHPADRPPPRCVDSSYFTLTMPNGRRRPYRLPFALEGTPSSPSPDHTSDSEETSHHKTKFRRLARTVVSQWRDFTKRSESSFDALWHCLGSGISWLITQTTVLQGPFLPLLYNSIKNSKFSRTTHTKRAGSEQYNVEKLKQLSRRFREDLGEPRYPIGDPRTAVVGTITYLDTHASSSSTS